MIFHLWILLTFYSASFQASDRNCIRENPGVLDADFSLFNEFEDVLNVTEKDVSNHIALFSSRFKRGHDFVGLNEEWMDRIGNGISLYRNTSKKDFLLFYSMLPGIQTGNLSIAISQYKDDYETVMKINSGHQSPVVGLYVVPQMDTHTEDLTALQSVFGTKENSTFPIGYASNDCLEEMRKPTDALKLMQRMDFITCNESPLNKNSPEKSAEDVLSTCDALHDFASSINVTAEIRCRVSYPSYGTTSEGIVGSVSDFQRFWCRIVDEAMRNQSHTRIIMASAFDDFPSLADYILFDKDFNDPKYHSGWWRRKFTTSYANNTFVEKVDELEGNTAHGSCTQECDVCSSSEECCGGTFCYPDSSFQLFKDGVSIKVCQSTSRTCTPRPPMTVGKSPLTPTAFVSSVTLTIVILSGLLIIVVVVSLIYHRKIVNGVNNQWQRIRGFKEAPATSPEEPSERLLEDQPSVEGLLNDLRLITVQQMHSESQCELLVP